jgi:succinate dehydrogenase / fumarate reductase, cytochrome b subunit
MADQPHKPAARPLSPFISVFRWPVTMATSIVHRATGVGLAGALAGITWWLTAAAGGPQRYRTFIEFLTSPLGLLLLFGFTWAMVFHLLNGIRHLAWDLGYGFQIKTANITGILVIVASLVVTVGLFALALAGYGGYYR